MWMKAEQSDPQLIQALVEGLQAWQNSTPASEDTSDTPAASKQKQIRWEALLEGWLSLEWQAQQAAYWAQWR